MEKKLTFEKVREFIDLEVDEFRLEDLRRKHGIAGDSSVFYTSMTRLTQDRTIKRIGRGLYRKVKKVKPVKVFGRERRPEVKLNPPIDRETLEPLDFFDDITFRAGDFILLSGYKNKGKTALSLNLIAENLDMNPLLMGNEYTIAGKDGEYEVAPRMANRFDSMDWVQWTNGDGEERVELLPVYQDYEDNILPGRLNVIDWINIPGEYYMISPLSEALKKAVGDGLLVGVLQKNPDNKYGRGGNPSKDFADVELLLDPYGEDRDLVKLTVETVKESRRPVMGKTFVYRIKRGVEIVDFREVVKCSQCYGKGWRQNRPCDNCNKLGYIDKPLNV